jgi:FixJ family two-component response regulator
MSGLELQRQIVTANWRIPIIFVTSYADGDEKVQALEAGAVDYLYKPFREEDLINAIDAALKHS